MWEEFEKEKITKDITMRVESNTADKDWSAENGDKLKDEEEKIVDEKLAERDDVQDEEHSRLTRNQILLEYQAAQLQENEELRARLDALKNIKVVKYGKFFQGLLYLLGYSWDSIVEPGTAIFNWKTAKTLLNDDFLEKLKSYQSLGSKDGEFKAYQSLTYIEKLIEGMNPEVVTEYNLIAGKLLSWL